MCALAHTHLWVCIYSIACSVVEYKEYKRHSVINFKEYLITLKNKMYIFNFVLHMNAQKCITVVAVTKSKELRRPDHCGKISVTT